MSEYKDNITLQSLFDRRVLLRTEYAAEQYYIAKAGPIICRETRSIVDSMWKMGKISRAAESFLRFNPFLITHGYQWMREEGIVLDGKYHESDDVSLSEILFDQGVKYRRDARRLRRAELWQGIRDKLKNLHVRRDEQIEEEPDINLVNRFLNEYHIELNLAKPTLDSGLIQEKLIDGIESSSFRPHYFSRGINVDAKMRVMLYMAGLDSMDQVLSDFIVELDPNYSFSENAYLMFASRGLTNRQTQRMTLELKDYITKIKKRLDCVKARTEERAKNTLSNLEQLNEYDEEDLLPNFLASEAAQEPRNPIAPAES